MAWLTFGVAMVLMLDGQGIVAVVWVLLALLGGIPSGSETTAAGAMFFFVLAKRLIQSGRTAK